MTPTAGRQRGTRFRRTVVPAVILAATVASLTACAPSHDLSLSESCRQWKSLSKGPGLMTPESNKLIDDDLRAAEPRMHEAVARQVKIYISYDRLNPTEEESAQGIDALMRLMDLCGT